jgi:SPP1 family predicted phage head-tail adaptor
MNLRDEITIQKFTKTSDGAGGNTIVWSDVVTIYAKVMPLRGSRGLEGLQLSIDEAFEVWYRWEDFPPLAKQNRLKFENKYFTIHSIKEVNNRRKYIKVICQQDAGKDTIIYDEQFQPIYDENGNYITT